MHEPITQVLQREEYQTYIDFFRCERKTQFAVFQAVLLKKCDDVLIGKKLTRGNNVARRFPRYVRLQATSELAGALQQSLSIEDFEQSSHTVFCYETNSEQSAISTPAYSWQTVVFLCSFGHNRFNSCGCFTLRAMKLGLFLAPANRNELILAILRCIQVCLQIEKNKCITFLEKCCVLRPSLCLIFFN